MHNERKVFGRICPNRIRSCHPRSDDKKHASFDEGQEQARNARNNVSVPIYIEENVSIVDEAFATIAWADLGDCTSMLRRESDSSGQQFHGSGFAIQDFVDSAVSFTSESPSPLDSSGCSSGSLPLSDCSFSDLHGCTILPTSSLPNTHLSQESLSQNPPAPIQGLPPAPPPDWPQDQLFWRDVAEQHQTALGEALDTNNQLCLTLDEKQEEMRSLRQRNLHLKELASQAKHLASVLSRLISPSGTLPPTREHHTLPSPTKRRRLEGETEGEEDVPPGEEVSRILRDVSERCQAALQEQAGDELPSPRMHGIFQGLLTSTPQRGERLRRDEDAEEGQEEEGTAFRTSIRDHSTIRTLTFPQGHAFTSRTPLGGCRFRWIPS